MATTEASPMLALPSAERPRIKNVANVAALAGGIGGLMITGLLAAAWVSVRHYTHPWPPDGVEISNYDGTMLVLTMLMSAVTVEWGIAAVRKDLRSQAVMGFVLSAGFGVAYVNLLWFFGRRLGVGVDSSAFAVLLYALLAVTGIAITVGVGVMIALTLRVLGHQVTAINGEMARAVGWFWQCLVLGSVVVYATVWLAK